MIAAARARQAWWRRVFDDRAAHPAPPILRHCGGARVPLRRGHAAAPDTTIAAFALLLHRYSGEDTVAFAVVEPGPHGRRAVPVRSRCAARSRPARWLKHFLRMIETSRRHGALAEVDCDSWVDDPVVPSAIMIAPEEPVGGSPDQTVLRLSVPGTGTAAEDAAGLADLVGRHLDACGTWLDGKTPFAELEILSPSEHAMLSGFEQPVRPIREPPCPIAGIAAAMRTHPGRTAVVCGDTDSTFEDLNRRVSAVAAALSNAGVARRARVALVMTPSQDYVAALIATLWTGAVAVPFDAEAPAAYHRRMIARLGIRILLASDPGIAEDYADLVETVVPAQCTAGGALTAPVTREPDEDVYVIHTSGSTGTPKPTPIPQRGFAALCAWYARELASADDATTVIAAPLTFDLTMKNIFAPLLKGQRIVLARSGDRHPLAMMKLIGRQRIAVWNGTPSAFNPILALAERAAFADLRSLRLVFLGGEPLVAAALRAWQRSPACAAKVINLYGPTECTDLAVGGDVTGDIRNRVEDLPLGRPIVAARIHVLDGSCRRQPVGVAGELCIGGPGVARGYIGLPEETQARFTPDPLNGDGAIYRTGDIVSWRHDGRLAFHGRNDEQVKVRGIRLEPGEIERRLAEHSGVREVAVIPVMRNGGSEALNGRVELEAHVVPAEADGTGTDFNQWLRARMPAYMIPRIVLSRDPLPRTRHGKIDRQALMNRAT